MKPLRRRFLHLAASAARAVDVGARCEDAELSDTAATARRTAAFVCPVRNRIDPCATPRLMKAS
jgi:hypothetical protein